MGRGRRNVNRFAQRKRDKKEQANNPQSNGAGAPDTRKHYEDIVKENAAFETYYKAQNIVPEDDWDTFMKTLRANLPTAFRITGSKSEANTMLDVVRSQYFAEILNNKLPTVEREEITEGDADKGNETEEEEIKPVCLPWYPGGLAWQLRLSRTDIRRSPPLYRLHNFLVAETAAGGVSRQETVSMIPPVVLDVKPHHKVLDMCAAPGSKTAQLLEFLHSEEDQIPTGFVVANDVDNSRCYMLVHQSKRLNSPCSIITNHDAAHMPTLTTKDKNGVEQTLQFDRILCDVPCSGDATLRKNPDIWLKWSPGNGNNLHGIQYRVLRRGAELLAVGGRLVYSTCSFNPLENEAVVHRILVEAEGSLQLVDSTPLLPGLLHSKGMTHWLPASKDLQFYNNYEEVPERWQTVVRPQMFPPKPEDAHKYNLDRCIRILPHQQDTGGFFVAAFEKVAPLPWESKKEQKTSADNSEIQNAEKAATEQKAAEPQRKKRRMGGYREDPFVFFSGENEDVFPSIKEFYKLSDDLDATCLLTRCYVGKKKNVYLVSPAIKRLVQMNENRIKIINTGIKTFVRCDNKNMRCAFRLSQEGLESIFQYIGAPRIVSIPHDDLVMMLNHDNPMNPPDLSLFSQETQERVKDLESGSCVLTHDDGDLHMRLVGWRGVKSLRAYTTTPHTVHMLRLLRADISRFDVDKFKKAEEEKAIEEGVQGKEAAEESLEDNTEDVPKLEDSEVTENIETMETE